MSSKALTLIVLGSIFLIACGFFFPFGRSPHGMNPGYGYPWSSFDSNGEQIYFTAINDRGDYIRYTSGPPFDGMMEGALVCASCHGEDGRGGQHVMHMNVMDAPDIRIATLSDESDEHQEGEHEGEHGEEYDLEAFRRAVVLGRHLDRDSLSRDMPRWQIDDEDLNDLFEFLKTLP